jgi:hypothetical protein
LAHEVSKKTAISNWPLALVVVGTAITFIFMHDSNTQFAEPDKKLANGSVELCSDYAKLCFIRPGDWTRSSILHAGLAKQNDIEINPPTGTILRFEAISDDTNTVCPTGGKCTINTFNTTVLENGLNIVSGVFDENSSNPNAISIYIPFVQLVNSRYVRSFDLKTGKSTSYTSFTPGVSFGNAPKVMLQISPGKGFDAKQAQQWLTSNEGVTAKQILSSVHSH